MLQPVEFYKLLSDETRLNCLLLICQQQELCVCELVCALNDIQPKISRHLAMLRKAGLLLDRRQGQWVFYRLNPALPDWACQSLQLALQQNPQQLAPLTQNLCAMGDRPTRQSACCP